jgi:Rap1a immunity proteins
LTSILARRFKVEGLSSSKLKFLCAAEEADEMTYKSNLVLAAVLALTSLTAGEATAASVTGEQLLYLCTSNMGGRGNPLTAAECMGFVVGVADTFDCVDATQLFNRNNSAKVSQPRLVVHVVEYLTKYPAAQKREAFEVVGLALAPHFPCQPTAVIKGIDAPQADN